jgi:NADPH:quinone reductase-like Zn-dependent oxidoreductase
VIAVTAWQMLFEYGKAKPNQTVMILGAAGNVGGYAVQLAVNAGLQVIGVVGSTDIEYVKALGSQTVVNYRSSKFQNAVRPVDLVLDTVGRRNAGTLIRRLEIWRGSCFCCVHCPYAGAT